MFIVKASFKNETRRFTLEQTDLPSLDQLNAQVQRIFPTGHAYYIANLRFSSQSGPEQFLAKEIHSAPQYLEATAHLYTEPWYFARLRFDLFDNLTSKPPSHASSRASMHRVAENILPQPAPSSAEFQTSKGDGGKAALQGLMSKFMNDFESIVSSNFGDESGISRGPEHLQPPHEQGQLHRGVFCDNCGSDIRGIRHKCTSCYVTEPTRGYDLCDTCVVGGDAKSMHATLAGSNHTFIALTPPQSRNGRMPDPGKHLHPGVICDKCDKQIIGTRHKCLECANYDLCDTCISDSDASHPHQFVNIHDPTTASQIIAEAQASRRPRHNADCNACQSQIIGARHKCLDCVDYDLCESCFENVSIIHPLHEFFKLNEPGRLVVHTIADDPSHNHYHNATCDLCDSRIKGYRYKCTDCPDFDVCERCVAITPDQHPQHVFVKIRHPQDIMVRSAVQEAVMHNAYCNVCMRTITGVRYKCMSPNCKDFDLCMNCEALPIPVHPETHPLWKIKSPLVTVIEPVNQPPLNEQRPRATNPEPREVSDSNNATHPPDTEDARVLPDKYEDASSTGTVKGASRASRSVPDQLPLHATFKIDNNIPDGAIIAPGAEFVKSWQMVNSGAVAWPDQTRISFIGGHRLAAFEGAPDYFTVGHAEPGSTVNVWAAEMKAPDEPGKYVSRWRLHDGQGVFFGDEVWCDIVVPEIDTGIMSHSGSVALPDSLHEERGSNIEIASHNGPTSSSSLPTNLISGSNASVVRSIQGQATPSLTNGSAVSENWDDGVLVDSDELAKGLDYLVVYDSDDEDHRAEESATLLD